MALTAERDSTCSDCDQRIRAGVDRIRSIGGFHPGQTRWVHEVCPEPEDPLAAPAGVCPSCHLALPVSGVCGECS